MTVDITKGSYPYYAFYIAITITLTHASLFCWHSFICRWLADCQWVRRSSVL